MRGGFPKGTVVRFSPLGIEKEGFRYEPRPSEAGFAGRSGRAEDPGASLWRGVVTTPNWSPPHVCPRWPNGRSCVNVRTVITPPLSRHASPPDYPLGPSIDINYLSPVPTTGDIQRQGRKMRHPANLERAMAVASALPRARSAAVKEIMPYLSGGWRRKRKTKRRRRKRKTKRRRRKRKTKRRR